jgi:hypothetical protein
MKKFLVVFAIFFLSSGFATKSGVTKMFNEWVGKPLNEVVKKYGPPDKEYKQDGLHLITYVQDKKGVSSPIMAATVDAFTGDICKVTFHFDTAGIVEKVEWDGNKKLCKKMAQ